MLVDLRGTAEKNLFSELRDIIRSLDCDELLDVVVESMAVAKKVKCFLSMSGCDVEIIDSQNCFIIKMKSRNCNCV